MKAVACLTEWTLGCADPGSEKLDLEGKGFGLATVGSIQVTGYSRDVGNRGALAVGTVADYCTVSRGSEPPSDSDMVAFVPDTGSLAGRTDFDHRQDKELGTEVDVQGVDKVLACKTYSVQAGEVAVSILRAELVSVRASIDYSYTVDQPYRQVHLVDP